ncbi:MAG: hypothetical protein HYT46_00060 [Candidatus Vogelbacteria bacterium]|nr:hypothetical protein [Candidatus Vogelbacteria bacterium]
MIVKYDGVSGEGLRQVLDLVHSREAYLRLGDLPRLEGNDFDGVKVDFTPKGLTSGPFLRSGSPGGGDVKVISIKAIEVNDTEPETYQITLELLAHFWVHNGGFRGCGEDDYKALKEVRIRLPDTFLKKVSDRVLFT